LHYAASIVPLTELEELLDAKHQPTKREMVMAEQLIESLAADFEPQKYHNTYYGRIMELIENKAAGDESAFNVSAEKGAKIIDLTAALEASLAAIKSNEAAKNRRRKARAQ
jgi:DNA end-binding protein Ku